jgi:hypothetical protein
MLLNSEQNVPQYFLRLSNGQELGPYASREMATASLATIPLREGEAPPQVIPRTAGGQQFLFG